ncbi:zinc finger, MIZ-type, zinc finger, RING/FYVE/PHD-type, E3 SUMO protein ligase [Tanacetum coccineum]
MYMMAAMAAGRRRVASLKGVIKLVEANIDQASLFIRSGDIDSPSVYTTTCLTLGSSIETAIGVNVVPSSSYLPQLLWIVTESACQAGWFSDEGKDCLLFMADQASLGYSSIDNVDIEPTKEHTIADIISRFYPRMTIEHIITSFHVQAGEGKSEANFYIAPNTVPNQNVWLLVARTDDIDTAACLTSPSNADFVINQSGVPNRTRKNMGKGPQLPSNVTKLVNDGVNCLKVFGEFDGEYVIALAYMILMSASDPPQLQDYVYPVSSDVNSDCVITEEISLICPSSLSVLSVEFSGFNGSSDSVFISLIGSGCRITTPVKGRLCKHFQCFDHEFFMKANSIRPSWKCPLPGCRKPISNLDIRIDKFFLKILNEAAENVSNVFISDDGSWTVDLPDIRHINGDTINQQIHVSDNTENIVSLDAHETPMPSTLYGEGSSAINMTIELSAVEQATATTAAVSPPQTVKDSSLMPQGSGDMVNTPSPIQETRHHLDPVNSTPAQLSEEIQLQNSQADQASEPESGTSIIRRARSTINRAVIPVQLTPPSAPPIVMQLRNRSKPNVGTTDQAQDTTVATAVKLRRGRKQRNIFTLCQPAPAPAPTPSPAPVLTPALITRPASPVRFQEPNEDAISCVRMRGGLEGEELEAARLASLAPPRQPIDAPDPWSIPLPGIPMEVLMSRPPISNSSN